jgi:hypothetical protein
MLHHRYEPGKRPSNWIANCPIAVGSPFFAAPPPHASILDGEVKQLERRITVILPPAASSM